MSKNPKVAAVEQYIQGLCEHDLDKVMALFAANATVEDPVGSEPKQGTEAITEFYKTAISSKIQAKLEGPVRLAGNYAVFPFTVNLDLGGSAMRIDVIDQFTFDEDNKIIGMKAFWSEENSSFS